MAAMQRVCQTTEAIPASKCWHSTVVREPSFRNQAVRHHVHVASLGAGCDSMFEDRVY